MRRLISIIFAVTAFASHTATAQSVEDIERGIEECKAISVEQLRSACLQAGEQFLQSQKLEANQNTASEPTPPAIQANTTALEAERVALAKERAELDAARAALETKSAEAAENERLGVLARLGLARNVKSSDKKVAATLTIDRVKANGYKRYILYTSDGDVLVQDTASKRMNLPESFPATATLRSGLFGSKWISFTEFPDQSYKVDVRRR